VLVYYQSFLLGGRWVRQPFAEVGLLEALADDAVRDLCWCAVLKFLRTLFLASPSDAAMAAMLGILEPMRQQEDMQIGDLIAHFLTN
jgi:hypothetical protein